MGSSGGKRSLALVVGYSAAVLLILFVLRFVLGFAGFTFWNSEKAVTTAEESIALSDSEITQLELKKLPGSAHIVLADVDEATLETKNMPDSFQWNVENGVLTLSCDSGNPLTAGFWNSFRTARLTVTLPQGTKLDRLLLQGGVGDFTLDSLTAGEITVKMGVGDLNLRRITAGTQCTISGGTGDCTLKDCDFKDADISVGVGDIEFSGALSGSCLLQGGIGDMDLALQNSASDYHITSSGGIGDVELNGKNIKNSSVGSESAPNALKIKSGIGDVEISAGR